jgi:endonuclease/exonuclease/phosphatase family metal-dependent hydrolase
MVVASVVFVAVGASRGPEHAGQMSLPYSRPTAPFSDLLTHSALKPCETHRDGVARRTTLRAATWNIAAARYAPLESIAAELRAMRADVILLQEVDHRLRRTGFIDQPGALAAALDYQYVFAASIKWDGGDYGLALLSRWPLVSVARHRLDVVGVGEPRIVLEVVVCANGRALRVFNHHADIAGASRDTGLARLTTTVQQHLGRAVLVAGDFNAPPDAASVRALVAAGLVDAGAQQNQPTSSHGRIDYLLIDAVLARSLRRAEVWPTSKSDHQPLVAEFHDIE